MIRKSYSRRVFVIEISQNGVFLGYYAGKDKDFRIHVRSLNDAIVFKTEKSVRHNVAHQEKYDGGIYSFKVVEAEETNSTIYYDEYDGVKRMKPIWVIMAKNKSDVLSEPRYVCDIDLKKESFKLSYDIEKAKRMEERILDQTTCLLSKRFSEQYEFYQETIFVKEERVLVLRNEL